MMAIPNAAITKELSSSLQVMSDSWLAWQLQAEEYKKAYQLPLSFSSMPSVFASPQSAASPLYQFQNVRDETVAFNLRATSINGDCFFDAVNRAGFSRDALVKKLIENPTESIRAIFAHEIRQFLYLGCTDSHPNRQENQACQQLLTSRIKQLFFALQSAEAAFRPRVDEARSELGARETHQKQPPELLALLRERKSPLIQKFEQAYQAVLNADKVIYDYCYQTEVFKNYVTLYLKEARGYIPFSRDFGREVPVTTIDIINQLFGLKIQVYLPHNQGGRQLQIANQLQTGEVIPIFHNGINHFWGLVLSSNPANAQVDLKEENDLNPPPQNPAVFEDSTVSLKPLPDILYDRKALDEIIAAIPMDADIKTQVLSHLENIEKQVSEIHRYQQNNHSENFCEAICTIILEIRNSAKAIYELTKSYHPSLPNALKERLLKSIIPLEAALDERLEMPESRDVRVLKTKHLYAEQSFVSRQAPLQQALMQHLGKVKELLLEPSHPSPRCYISYAWPSKENKTQEYWVQPFLNVLYDHLTAAGVRVVMDIRDNKPGDSIYRFMEQYHEGNYIILVGTESLLQKHYSITTHTVQTELSIILNRFEQDQKQFGQSRIYPMLVSGTLKTAYPEGYQLYSTVKDTRDQGYLGTLKNLTDWIYEHPVNAAQLEHARLWRTFNEAYPGLSKESKAIEAEIAFKYHQECLDYLRQDLQYQSVLAQERIKHNQAVEAEMIDILRASQGTNLKALFDGNGEQFQRPYSSADFIERQDLWDKMVHHFSAQSQLILTLHGIAGVGKTELARHYFLHPSKPYTLRAWFNASSIEELCSQYIAFAMSNGVELAPQMPTKEKIKGVKQWLEQQKNCLLIYDNVPDAQTLAGLLPEIGIQHILMTTRHAVAGSLYQTVDVGVMKEDEAIALVCKITGYSQKQPQLKELVYELELLPLKLRQAGHYMAVKGVNSQQYRWRYQQYKAYLQADAVNEAQAGLKQSLSTVFEAPLKSLEQKIERDVSDASIALALPSIVYDRKALQEIIDGLSMPPEIVTKVVAYLDNIENRVSEISQYQSMQNVINFYETIHTALLEIRNTAHEIYKLTEIYHPNFPDIIRKQILQGIVSLEIELEKRLDAHQRQEQALKTKRLYAEQSFIARQTVFQQSLMPHLEKLKQLFVKPNEPAPRCYIIYAWPSEKNRQQEYWVQPFLVQLYAHLTAVGIQVLMDIRDIKLGESIYQFMKQYQENDYLILVGSESLLQKHDAETPHAIQTALHIGLNRMRTNQRKFGQNRIYPMLISGTLKTAYPERYQVYFTVRDTRERGYLGTLKGVIDWIYEHQLEAVKQPYANLWKSIHETYPALPQEPNAIETEIALGYHQQQLEALQQDSQYQGVAAQEKTQHSAAMDAEMISVWMKFREMNPKPLFDKNGQQFQRPFENPDFIERRGLWDKMTKHFAATEQQILLLTAHGLGGMGKTELAGRYFLHPPKAYDLRAWFNASSKESLFFQYIDLAESNGMKFAPNTPIEEKVVRVKRWLEQKKDCLLIYDNVPNAEMIAEWLPKQGKHHILMTSRNAVDWPVHQTLDVDVMEEHEAIALICKITGYAQDEPQLKELVQTLGLLPLALAQAGAYMKAKNKRIAVYLLEYQQSHDSLIAPNIDRKHEPIWVTFNMNFKSLQEACPAALMTLKQASWLSHALIPEELLFLMTDSASMKPRELLWDDIKEQVKRYSLMRVDAEQLYLGIHPLLQDIIRSKQDAEEQLQQFKACTKVLNAIEQPNYQSNLVTYRALLPHAERLRGHAKEIAISVVDNKARDLLLIEPTCLTMLYPRLGLNQQALTFLAQAISIQEKHYGKEHPETVKSLRNLGSVYLSQGKLEQAKEHYERALKITEQYYDKDHVETAVLLGRLGDIYRKQGKIEQAKEHYERALNIKEHHYGKDHVLTAALLGNLGNVCSDQGKLEQAKEYYERALKIKECHYDEEHVEIAAELGNVGNVYLKQGKFEQARAYYDRALKINERHYGKDHVQTAVELENLGTVYLKQGNFEQAKEHYDRALRIKERHYGKEHAETAALLGNLGNVYLEQGNFEQARAYYDWAFGIDERHYGKEHVRTAAWLGNFGNIYFRQGKFKQATEHYERALRIKERHYVNDHIEMAMELGGLGAVYLHQGNLEQARKYTERALNIQERHYGKEHAETAALLGNLGTVYQKQGKLEQAKEHYERELSIKERHYGKDHPEVANTLFNLAVNNVVSNQIIIAVRQLQRASAILFKHFPGGHPMLIKIAECLQQLYSMPFNPALGSAQKTTPTTTEGPAITTLKSDIHRFSQQAMKHYRAQEYKEAIESFQQALSLQEQIDSTPNDKEEIATLHFNLGSAYLLQKNYPSAKTSLQTAYDMRLTLLGSLHAATQKAQSRLQECQRAIEQELTLNPIVLENKTERPDSIESAARPEVLSTTGLDVHPLGQEGRDESSVVQSSPALESEGASSVVTSESLSSNQPMTRSENQLSAQESESELLPQIPSNRAQTQRIYCPYFSKTALISFSILAGGVALEAGRRYYFKP